MINNTKHKDVYIASMHTHPGIINVPRLNHWHFDKFRKDAEGEYVKIVGVFGDWQDDIDTAREVGVHEQGYNEQDYGHA